MTGINVQLYKFYRLGREGYTRLCSNMMTTAAIIRKGLASFRDEVRLIQLLFLALLRVHHALQL